MREVTRYELLLEAVEPIAHAEGNEGNASLAMRRKYRLADGTFERIATITGDTMRHKLRDTYARLALDATGMMDGEGPRLTEAALRLLFNGGMLTGRGAPGAVKLDEFRRMLTVNPGLALLGGCANNHMIEGQLQVSDAMLVCLELAHMLPPWVVEYLASKGVKLGGHRAHMDEEMRVRMDASRTREGQRLLEPGARDAVERRLVASEQAHDEDNAIAREANKFTMLPRTQEVIAPGALFYWEITATTNNDLERDALLTTLMATLYNLRVGGKGASGHGKLRGVAANQVPIARPRDASTRMDLAAFGEGVGAAFKAHMREHAAAFKAQMQGVDA
jgi:hypothetical protein